MGPSRFLGPVVGVLILLGAACGDGGGDAAEEAGQSVAVTVSDAGRFTPAELSFPVGTTVKFVFRNDGKELHEAVFGDQHFQDDHEKEMKEETSADNPHMDEHKTEDFVEIEPGKSAEFTYTFDDKGTFFIACHVQPGHYDRGEKITVTVT